MMAKKQSRLNSSCSRLVLHFGCLQPIQTHETRHVIEFDLIFAQISEISAIASLRNKSKSPSDNNPIRADAVLFEFIDDRK